MKIHNLYGRDVTLVMPDGTIRNFPKESMTATVKMETYDWEPTDGIPTTKLVYQIVGLPTLQPGDIVYLVHASVLAAAVVIGRPISDLRVPSNPVPGRPGFFTKLVSG